MVPSRPPLALTPEGGVGLQNLYLATDWGQLGCLGSIQGVGGFEEVAAQSISITLPSGPCRVLGIDALIRAKEAMGRDRDREAVLQLLAIRERLGRDAG
jgi:hypothetical protein